MQIIPIFLFFAVSCVMIEFRRVLFPAPGGPVMPTIGIPESDFNEVNKSSNPSSSFPQW
jgi:hypothetical protein